MAMSQEHAAEISAGITGALFARLTEVKEPPMAGVLKKTRKPKQKPFRPSAASRIQTIEDPADGLQSTEDVRVPMRKMHGSNCTLHLAEQGKEVWLAWCDVIFPANSNLLSRTGKWNGQDKHGSRTEALFYAISTALSWCRIHAAPASTSFIDRKRLEDCEEDLVKFQTETARKYRIPGRTSTVTPGGILANDPDAVVPSTNGKPPEGQAVTIPLASIDPSPTNPRQHFDADKLEELAATLRSVGLLQPLVVRRQKADPDRYELVAGERRYRAAKIAKLDNVPATLRQLTDAQVLEIQCIENLQREDISAIEEAAAFQRMCLAPQKGGAGFSQTQLAERLGCTQAHISNRVRLLELPAEWQQRVLKGELPPTHARALVPWVKYPQVLKEMARVVKREGPQTAEQFEDDLRRELHQLSRPMSGTEYNYKLYRQVPVFKPTEEQRAKLEIVQVPGYRGNEVEERAFNKTLWQQLQDKHAAEVAKKADKKDDRKSKADKDKPLTPAQQKAKEKKLAEQFANRLDEWKADWLRMLVAAKLQPGHWVTYKFALYFLAGGSESAMRFRASAELADVLDNFPTTGRGKKSKRSYDGWGASDDELFDSISEPAIAADNLPAVMCELLKRWLVDRDESLGPAEPQKFVPLPVLEQLCKDLQIDLAAAWKVDRAGELTEAYFRLHTTEQLRTLASELRCTIPATATKGGAVNLLMLEEGLPLPKELQPRKAKGPASHDQRKAVHRRKGRRRHQSGGGVIAMEQICQNCAADKAKRIAKRKKASKKK